jgi:hypothetical protein
MNTSNNPGLSAFATQYRPFQNLPPLAGLGSFVNAIEPGISVEDSVARLKRHHYLLRRLHHVFIARLTSEPIYELKMTFSYHAYLCAEHVTALRQRVGEMREPPLGLDRVPHSALEVMGDELLGAADTTELLLGIYEIALPHVMEEMHDHLKATHLLADQPTRRLCKAAILELEEMVAWGSAAIRSLVRSEQRTLAEPWLSQLRSCAGASRDAASPAPARVRSIKPFVYDPRPKRDQRFPDPYNMGVNAEVFLYDPEQPADAKVLMMFYKRLREIDVPEMMASILTETPDKPWGYYRDLTRQIWDEARHAMMGEVGFVSAGVDWPRNVLINFTWSLGLNTQLTPKERHAVLYFIEQGLMPKTGKRHEWEVSLMAQNALASTFQDYDWADEVLHARVGRDWYVSAMPSAKEAVEYGDRCWSKVLANWETWRAQGLTQHRNWWPDTYRAYCAAQGRLPDPAVLSYATTYESTRADLKAVTGSA